MRSLAFLFLLIMVSCKTPEYTAKSKGDLAKLCVYEFPLSSEPIRSSIDTLVINDVRLERIEVDCDTIGKKQVDVPVSRDTVFITETNWLKDQASFFYAQSLEGKIENMEALNKEREEINKEKLRKITKDKNRLTAWLVVSVGGAMFFLYNWIRK